MNPGNNIPYTNNIENVPSKKLRLYFFHSTSENFQQLFFVMIFLITCKCLLLGFNCYYHVLLPHTHTVHILLDIAYIPHILEWSPLPLLTVMVENMQLKAMEIGKYFYHFSLICSINSLCSTINRCKILWVNILYCVNTFTEEKFLSRKNFFLVFLPEYLLRCKCYLKNECVTSEMLVS